MKKILVDFIELYVMIAVSVFAFMTIGGYVIYGEFRLHEGTIVVPIVFAVFLVTVRYISERRLMK